MAPDFKKPRDRRLLEIAKDLCSEIKNLTHIKNESNKRSVSIINNELKSIENEIETRRSYLVDNGISPDFALQYLESLEKSQNPCANVSPKKHSINNSGRKVSSSTLKNKFKKYSDSDVSDLSFIENSETYAYSVSTHKKSPSRIDTLSCFETSPMFKRLKVSEEEEKLPLAADQFSLGDSFIQNQYSSQNPRKSSRSRTKSKILREASGEDYESIFTDLKSK